MNRVAAQRLLPYVVAATCGFFAVAPLILASGIPAYQHDWSFPFTVQGVKSGLVGHFALWDETGLGRPNPLASANPLLVLLSGLGLIFGPLAGAKIAIGGATILSSLTAAYCAQRVISGDRLAAALAGILYATSPVIFNKIAAGQVTFWYAYALLPLIFERSRAAQFGNRAAIFWTALLCALTTIQPQFALFSPIVALSATLPLRNTRTMLIVLCASVTGVLIALAPTAWAIFAARSDLLAQFPWPLQSWEVAHSAPLPLALLTSHYIIPYYATALHGMTTYALAVAAAGIFGTVLAIRRRDGIPLLVLILVGLCFTTGTVGPLKLLWSWMFAHFEAAASFRELYNANALIALAYSLGAAALAREALIGKLLAPALVVFSAVPILFGGIASVVHNVVDNGPSFRAQIAASPPGRILYLPSLTPLVRNGHEPGGVDVFATGDSSHLPATEYPAQFPLTTIALSGNIKDHWWQERLEKLGITAIVMRPNLRSEFDVDTAGTRPAPNWRFVQVRGRPLVQLLPRASLQTISFREALTQWGAC